ncbi:MAG: heme-degrading domain-containing protein [Candidatus Limiplasma sp.]|nr:heme-degrading domain-containing protein [Candidatus Limiplasma sp.]
MELDNTDRRRMLERIQAQEELLQFETFTFADGWQLGLTIREQVLAHGGDAAVDVTVGGVQLFRCAVGNPAPNNSRWIRRKQNTVLEQGKSSLRVAQEMALSGRTLEEFGLTASEFALSGGGFPIRVRGMGVIGVATVSGLPQTHDHQMVVNAMAAALHRDVPDVRE